jgi:hypothetical protein
MLGKKKGQKDILHSGKKIFQLAQESPWNILFDNDYQLTKEKKIILFQHNFY